MLLLRLLMIVVLVVGVGGLALSQEPKVEPKEEPKVVETYVETPHWTKKIPLELVQVAMSVIIAALLGLAVSQLAGLRASIDKLADKGGG